MKSITLHAIVFACVVSGCASERSTLTSLSDGPHKVMASNLLQRNPSEDAAVFCRSGGEGYIMSSGGGGLIFPVGLQNRDEEYSARFEDLQPFEPVLYSKLAPLLVDPEGGLTITEISADQISRERAFYLRTRSLYAVKFNKCVAENTSKKRTTRRIRRQ
jgi:hypothetical protein